MEPNFWKYLIFFIVIIIYGRTIQWINEKNKRLTPLFILVGIAGIYLFIQYMKT